MDAITTVGSIFTSVKAAIDITKLIKESGVTLEEAEAKLQFAELIGALAEVKIELSELQELIAEKDKIIEELKESLKIKATVVKHRDAYYAKNENGNPQGDPYCLNCWETNRWLRSLHNVSRQTTQCPACKTSYLAYSTFKIFYNADGGIQYERL